MGGGAKYIYGVIHAAQETSFGGLAARSKVYAIPFKDIAAVLSDQPIVDHSSLPKPELVKELATHQAVIEEVMKGHTVVPFKFGTYAGDRAEVTTILRTGYDRLQKALDEIEGKIELDLIALWNMAQVLGDVYRQDRQVQELQKRVALKPDDEALRDKVELGRLIAFSLDRLRMQYAREILDFMQECAVDHRENTLFGETVVANTAFLVQRQNEVEFEKALHALDEKLDGRLNFRCVGPLPPYSFSTLEVRRVCSAELDGARRVLGVNRAAGMTEIKRAYRDLIRESHPDVCGGSLAADGRFKKITEAYRLLDGCCKDNFSDAGDADGGDYISIGPVAFEVGESGRV